MRPSSPSSLRFGFATSLLLSAAIGLGCSSSSSGESADAGVGGAILGMPSDNWCSGVTPILVSQASCHVAADAGVAADDGGADGGGDTETLPIHYGDEADDDDCKYHVSFTTTGVKVNQNATFKVTATKLAENNAPATGADVIIEAYLAGNALHPIPNGVQPAVENPAGTYTVAPVKFDASGMWVMRFHLYESCDDILPDSPHGHATFYINVP
jgi:hypothetical protein